MAKRKTVVKQPLVDRSDEWLHVVGKSTFLRLDWKDFKKEQPKSGDDIYVIVKFFDGCVPVRGTYFDEVLPANGPFKASRWRQVRLAGGSMLFLDNKKDAKQMVAWARPKLLVTRNLSPDKDEPKG